MNYLFTKNVEKLGIDLMTFNGSKIYGPKGVGVLYKKRGIKLEPLYLGGGQEFGLRSGTENTALIVGLAEALRKTEQIKEKETNRLIGLRDYAIDKILKLTEEYSFKIILNGDREKRLANNINVSIFGISSELLVLELGAKGIFVSERSDCKSGRTGSSHVLESIYGRLISKDEKVGSLRITLGRQTKKRDLDKLIRVLNNIFQKYQPWIRSD
jgi:cysteine desulfurase